jgi:hypothetical protein
MTDSLNDSSKIEISRFRHATWLAIVGLIIAAALVIFLVAYGKPKMDSATEVVGIVGLFTSVTGTIVGAFFGVQIGAAGVEHERKSRQSAEHITRKALAHMSKDDAMKLMNEIDRP